MVAELDSRLQHYWYYRMVRHYHLLQGMPVQDAIMAWNDTVWRRKHQVVKVLDTLASELELKWLREERIRLTAVVSRLQSQLATLQTRVKKLEDENSKLRRLTNSFTLRADRRQLEQLEDELATTWEQLTALPEEAIS